MNRQNKSDIIETLKLWERRNYAVSANDIGQEDYEKQVGPLRESIAANSMAIEDAKESLRHLRRVADELQRDYQGVLNSMGERTVAFDPVTRQWGGPALPTE